MATGRQFKPGESGNPGGRKRGVERVFQDAIKNLKHGDAEGAAALVARLGEIAFKGADRDSVAAIKLMCERAFGQPKATVEIQTDGEIVAAPTIDWNKVPLELRRQLLAHLREEPDDGTPTEH